jgi:putative addiction module antidote
MVMYEQRTNMKKKIVRVGNSLAVTLPRELVEQFNLKPGMEVEATINPRNGRLTVEAGVAYFESGKVTKKFEALADRLIRKRKKVLERLA